ncbi:MAG: cydC [Chloroflexi bacterium]|nr:cydC [Chloroflexota bacterium]
MTTVVRVLSFLRPYRLRVLAAIALGCATVAANIGLVAVAGYLIAAAALKPALLALSVPIYLVRFFGVTRAFLRYGERLVSHSVTFALLAEMRIWFYSRLEPLAPASLSMHRTGDVLARMVKDIDELENVYLRVFSPLIVALVTASAVAVLLGVFNLWLMLVAIPFLLLAGLGVPLLGRALAARVGEDLPHIRGELSAQAVDSIQGMQDLLIFGREASVRGRIAALERQSGSVERRLTRVAALQSGIGDFLAAGCATAVVTVAIPLVTTGRIGGVYLAFLAVMTLATFEVLQPLATVFPLMDRTRTSGDRLFEIADSQPNVREAAQTISAPLDIDLEFSHVSFAYNADMPPVLDDVTFSVRRGMHVAVVGASGSGKSTLLSLALRFWDVDAGMVKFGGADARQLTLDAVRAQISVVMQEVALFTDTLRNNLRIARPDATEADLLWALDTACLGDLVDRLPDGLDSWIGEQGLQLSGGERQRLAIARALLKTAPILALDEATANLDPITEATVLSQLLAAATDRAVLLITHRLVAMEEMDEILVLDRGRIVERGTHAELVDSRGAYWRLQEAQNELFAIT